MRKYITPATERELLRRRLRECLTFLQHLDSYRPHATPPIDGATLEKRAFRALRQTDRRRNRPSGMTDASL